MPTTVVQNLPKILSENLPQIEAACHQFGIKRLFVFGSALSDRFTDASDIDFLYEFDDSAKNNLFHSFLGLKHKLEEIVNRKVDLVSANSLRNPYFIKSIEKNKQLIYERAYSSLPV